MGKTATKTKPCKETTIGAAIPVPLERYIEDVLDPDTQGGQEDSAAGRLIRDWNADKPITDEHRPILLREARHLLRVIEDADEWQEYPDQARERRQLKTFISRFQ